MLLSLLPYELDLGWKLAADLKRSLKGIRCTSRSKLITVYMMVSIKSGEKICHSQESYIIRPTAAVRNRFPTVTVIAC